VLNLENTGVRGLFTKDFYIALGESKSLRFLNISEASRGSGISSVDLGRAIGMNAYKKGALRILGLKNGLENVTQYEQFIAAMYISQYDHENMYGD